MTRAQIRKIAIIVVLIVLLGGLGAYYQYYKSTHQLSFKVVSSPTDTIDPPQFLYGFAGTTVKLAQPIGVLVDNGQCYVVDAAAHTIFVYAANDGRPLRAIGASETIVPLYIAKSPKDGLLYVSDRRARTIWKFTTAGKFMGEFKPNLPKDQLPTFQTHGIVWAPVGIAFAPDGTMYVTEILKGHRLLIFTPDGVFKKSIGTVGIVNNRNTSPAVFQFPNCLVYHNGLVYISDSNNGRVQVFDKDGNFKQFIVTQGLPRGIDFLHRFPGDKPTTPDRFVEIDTLSHDGTIWNTKGTKILSFGQQGSLDGQFSYPDGMSIDARNRIFIADTQNGRIQVWGWPNQVSPVPIPTVKNPWWCLAPLLLLPLLLLLRRKKFFTTPDFVHAMVDAQQADLMPGGRRKWLVTEADYETLKDITQGDVDMAHLLIPTPYSESDVKALMSKLEVDERTAIVLALAQRAKVFTTEDADYRRLAKLLEVDVINRTEYLERFAKKVDTGTTPPSGPGADPSYYSPDQPDQDGTAASGPSTAVEPEDVAGDGSED